MCFSARFTVGLEKGAKRVNEWLEGIYTFLSRLWDYLTYVFDYINDTLQYVYDSAGNVLSLAGSFPAVIASAIFLSVAVCIFLFVLGR